MTQIRIIAALLAVIALAAAVLAYGRQQYTAGVERTAEHYQGAIDRQKAQAAATLADETEKTRLLERALLVATRQQEQKDATHQKTVADLADRLHAAAGPLGRLRDPNAPRAGCWPGGGGTQGAIAAPADAGAANAADAHGLLSVQLSDLLARLLREADDINAAYASCRADAYAVRATAQP